ncbi:hypothetical protein KC19_5G108000 [Ceratodon purpureus]|uniref:ATP-dependent Clp protease proteolytic subunit n=1 Tax=Ceratodon purpureus TaxID=3225 RepID=A0A8T0I033_CERPU|nr:hypothetical protein KC19_5G108000 [Ceratodon purpureus]
MAAMAMAMSMSTASPKVALPGALASPTLSLNRSSVRLAKLTPRASVSSDASPSLWSPDTDVRPVQNSLFTPTASQSAPAAMRSAESDVMGLMLRQRIVFLGNQMDDFVADAIISQLLLLDAVDPKKDIRLFINCPGGSISAAMGIFDAIQLCRADVSTICFGFAASTAAVVLAGGTRGKRLAMPNSRIMMHQPLGGASGQAIDVEIQAKEVMYHKDNITRILSEITGRSLEQVDKDIDRDRYMSPIEAMEYGIIDGVIDKDAMIAINELPVVSERVKPRQENLAAMEDPRKFLTPEIPDDEIY